MSRLLDLIQASNSERMEKTGKFKLGQWLVDPQLGRISHADRHVDLQPQVMDLLVYFLEHPGQVITIDELHSNLWKDRVVTTASIYTSLKQLRAALVDDARDPRYVKTIPKRGYQLIAAVENLNESDPVASPKDESDRDQGSRWGRAVITLLGISLAIALLTIFMPGKQGSGPMLHNTVVTQDTSIAVLPFSDMTPDQDHGWFTDGMTEEILNKLALLPGLKVTGRQSSFSFRNSDADLPTIGATLGVSHLLEGSVRRDGEKVRVTAQLIRADDGFHVWSQEFDRNLLDSIAIQDEISNGIARALALEISSVQAPESMLVYPRFSAYELYLRSLQLIDQHTKDSLLAALEYLQKALGLEPDFAEAHVAIARVYRALTNFTGFYEVEPYMQSDDLAMPHLERALALNPDFAEAQLLLGDMSDNPGDARQAYERALALNPNLYRAHMSLAVLVMDELRPWSDCVMHLEHALEIEPLSIEAATMMIQFMQRVPHRWPEAETLLANLERRYPDSRTVRRTKAQWLMYVRGQPSAAVPILQDLLVSDADDGVARGLLLRSWFMLGENERAMEFRMSPFWVFVLAPDRQSSLRQMAEFVEEMKTWAHENTYAHRMLYAYTYVMLREWKMAIDLLAEDTLDLDRLTTSMPAYVQQLALSESPAMTLAVAYKNLGDQANFEKFAAFERKAVNARSGNGRLHNQEYSRVMARLYAMEGRPYQAILELRYLVANGVIDPRDLRHPAFDELRDDPEFRKLEELQLQRINEQRIELGLVELPIRN